MLKFASFQTIAAVLAPADASPAQLRALGHRHEFKYTPRAGYLYVRSRAISSRTNDNYDEFPGDEIEKSYKTFVGKPVFVNHVNDNHKRARGVVIDAALHKDKLADGQPDVWVEALMEIDAVRFPKLAKAIIERRVDRTSMGCDVQYSICSMCGNKATTPAEYCQHIPRLKGKKVLKRNARTGSQEEHLIRETCYGLAFFENSLLVEEPADPTAFFLGEVDTRGLGKAASKHEPECDLCGGPHDSLHHYDSEGDNGYQEDESVLNGIPMDDGADEYDQVAWEIAHQVMHNEEERQRDRPEPYTRPSDDPEQVRRARQPREDLAQSVRDIGGEHAEWLLNQQKQGPTKYSLVQHFAGAEDYECGTDHDQSGEIDCGHEDCPYQPCDHPWCKDFPEGWHTKAEHIDPADRNPYSDESLEAEQRVNKAMEGLEDAGDVLDTYREGPTKYSSWTGQPCQECGGPKPDMIDEAYTPICGDCANAEAYHVGLTHGLDREESRAEGITPSQVDAYKRGHADGTARAEPGPPAPRTVADPDPFRDSELGEDIFKGPDYRYEDPFAPRHSSLTGMFRQAENDPGQERRLYEHLMIQHNAPSEDALILLAHHLGVVPEPSEAEKKSPEHLRRLWEYARGLQAIQHVHHHLHEQNWHTPSGEDQHTHKSPFDPVTTREGGGVPHDHRRDRADTALPATMWGEGPLQDSHRVKDHTFGLHPERTDAEPNVKDYQDINDPHDRTNLSACPKVYPEKFDIHTPLDYEEACDHCKARKVLHAAYLPSEVGRVKPEIMKDRSDWFFKRNPYAPTTREPLKPPFQSLSSLFAQADHDPVHEGYCNDCHSSLEEGDEVLHQGPCSECGDPEHGACSCNGNGERPYGMRERHLGEPVPYWQRSVPHKRRYETEFEPAIDNPFGGADYAFQRQREERPLTHSPPQKDAEFFNTVPEVMRRLIEHGDYGLHNVNKRHAAGRPDHPRLTGWLGPGRNEGWVRCDQGHEHWGVEGSAGVLIRHVDDNGEKHYLLQHRAPWVDHGGTYSIPGGALEPGESPEEAAKREAHEELGHLPKDLTHVRTHEDSHGGWSYFTAIYDSPSRFDPSTEHTETGEHGHGWHTKDEIDGLDLHPGFRHTWGASLRREADLATPHHTVPDLAVPSPGPPDLASPYLAGFQATRFFRIAAESDNCQVCNRPITLVNPEQPGQGGWQHSGDVVGVPHQPIPGGPSEDSEDSGGSHGGQTPAGGGIGAGGCPGGVCGIASRYASRDDDDQIHSTPENPCESCGSTGTHFHIHLDEDTVNFYRQMHEQGQRRKEMAEHSHKRVVDLSDPTDTKQHMVETHGYSEDDWWRNSHVEDHEALGPSGDDDRPLTHMEVRRLHDWEHGHGIENKAEYYDGGMPGHFMGNSHFHQASRKQGAKRIGQDNVWPVRVKIKDRASGKYTGTHVGGSWKHGKYPPRTAWPFRVCEPHLAQLRGDIARHNLESIAHPHTYEVETDTWPLDPTSREDVSSCDACTIGSVNQAFAGKKKDDGPTHSGLALKAADTGRVLMIQRSNKDEKDPAKGCWEFPGGGHEDGDLTSLHAAVREFGEEVGQPVPEGGTVSHVWRSPNGVYQGHVVVIPTEDAIDFSEGRSTVNPDDPDGDDHEQSAWWEIKHARENPALRPECRKSPWDEIRKAKYGKTALGIDPTQERGRCDFCGRSQITHRYYDGDGLKHEMCSECQRQYAPTETHSPRFLPTAEEITGGQYAQQYEPDLSELHRRRSSVGGMRHDAAMESQGVPGTIYLLHFSEPFGHARHYLGWARDLEARLWHHQNGTGANLLRHVKRAGITWRVARTWEGDRNMERRLKIQGGHSRKCPMCRGGDSSDTVGEPLPPHMAGRDDGLSFTHSETQVATGGALVPAHQLEAHKEGVDYPVARMWWRKDNGEVDSIVTHPKHYRQGIASAMWEHAHSLGVTPPKHSDNQTEQGRAWSQSLGSLTRMFATESGVA